MKELLAPATRLLVPLLAMIALGISAPVRAAVIRWNVQAVRSLYPVQNFAGYFDYDTAAATITGCSLAVPVTGHKAEDDGSNDD